MNRFVRPIAIAAAACSLLLATGCAQLNSSLGSLTSPPSGPALHQLHSVGFGTIVGMQETERKDGVGLVGAGVGAGVGGLLGHLVGGGKGKLAATVLGAIGGGFAGNQIEKAAAKQKVIAYTIGLDCNGQVVTVYEDAGKAGYDLGQRVQVIQSDNGESRLLAASTADPTRNPGAPTPVCAKQIATPGQANVIAPKPLSAPGAGRAGVSGPNAWVPPSTPVYAPRR